MLSRISRTTSIHEDREDDCVTRDESEKAPLAACSLVEWAPLGDMSVASIRIGRYEIILLISQSKHLVLASLRHYHNHGHS